MFSRTFSKQSNMQQKEHIYYNTLSRFKRKKIDKYATKDPMKKQIRTYEH